MIAEKNPFILNFCSDAENLQKEKSRDAQVRRLYNTTRYVEPAEHLRAPPDCFYFTTMLTSRLGA